MHMSNEQIAATSLAGMEVAAGFAQVQFSVFERLYALSFNATKSSFEEGANYARALLEAREVQQCLDLSTAYGQPAIEKAYSYMRSCLDVGTHARDEMTRLLEAQTTDINRKAAAFLSRLVKYAPGGTEAAAAAIKTAFETADNIFSGVTAVVQESGESTQARQDAPTAAARESKKKAA
jgi:phasin family protein